MAELHRLHLDFSMFQISELARKTNWTQLSYFQAAQREGVQRRIPGVTVASLAPTSHPEGGTSQVRGSQNPGFWRN